MFIVPYDIVCVPVGEAGWIDPPGGPDDHGRSLSQPLLGGGGVTGSFCHCDSVTLTGCDSERFC